MEFSALEPLKLVHVLRSRVETEQWLEVFLHGKLPVEFAVQVKESGRMRK
jgi:hypothetical protein